MMEGTAEARIVAWLEARLGRVVRIERQPRWRPAWFVDVERAGGVLPLYVRGDREGMAGSVPVSLEAAVLERLEAAGVPVPHVYGLIDAASAVVMDRLPGRANLATAESDAARGTILDHYMDVLAVIHARDPGEFTPLGFAVPPDAEALALGNFDRFERRYRPAKQRPEPLLEFGIKWLRRNVPRHRYDPRFILGDPAQFMFEGDRMTGLIDVELAHIGDVAHDLAGLRLRTIPEPLGDIGRAFRRYEAASGQALDRVAIEFHTAQFSLATPMSLVGELHAPRAVPETLQYLEWFHQYSLTGIEAIAAILGVDLPVVALLQPAPGRHAGMADTLPGTIGDLLAADPDAAYRRDATARTARFAQRAALFGPGIEAANLEEIAALTGARHTDWQSGDAALEAFVLAAGPEHDAALVALFHARTMRQMLMLEPVLHRTGRIEHLAPLPD
ncbi:phosphotransferase [Sphingomonas montanisoli]|uniref:Phosphotransferase n=1 Tax=Sphingomonas montanisoli TaxID=2606412 RepID=A0A5D9CAB2_9SPHN|nr:phosphotransferase [Sphingomonas montanisoli]TZG28000.1 phosphotransferase [Sphingomonas montanisoli]